MPNSVVFDHPTVNALAAFVNSQLGDVVPSAAPMDSKSSGKAMASAELSMATPVKLLEHLNDRTVGRPLFLVPGAGMQAGGFRSLAALLPVPVYGFSWPKDIRPRSEWPSTLSNLAATFIDEARLVQPSGPLFLAGHSFGATVALEMVRLIEKKGDSVALAMLFDPRNLPPLDGDISKEFGKTTLADSLALLSQTVPDGSRYAEYLEELARVDVADQEAAMKQMLSSGMMASLEHVHKTSQWYTELLHNYMSSLGGENLIVKCERVVTLHTAETWHSEPSAQLGRAETMVREFMQAVFQTTDDVTRRVKAITGLASPTIVCVPGTHFSMLHEPNVATLALKICSKLDDAGALDF